MDMSVHLADLDEACGAICADLDTEHNRIAPPIDVHLVVARFEWVAQIAAEADGFIKAVTMVYQKPVNGGGPTIVEVWGRREPAVKVAAAVPPIPPLPPSRKRGIRRTA